MSAGPAPDRDQARAFLSRWLGDGRDDWLVSLSRIHPGTGRVVPYTGTKGVTLQILGRVDFEDYLRHGGEPWNLYHGVGFSRAMPDRGRRGRKDNVRGVPGFFLDLDVKEGAFGSEAEALAFAESLPIPPSILVATGAGGVHAYWRTTRLLSAPEAEELLRRWWLLASEKGPAIDKLTDSTRIMRTPGSVRWAKPGEAGGSTLCRVVTLDGPECRAEDALELTADAWAREEERRQSSQVTAAAASQEAIQAAAEMTGWAPEFAAAWVQEHFNARVSWDYVLRSKGWQPTLDWSGEPTVDSDGRRIWSRPGGGPRKRSAAVDWPQSPHVMALFSNDRATGLADLKDRGVALTKYRVHAQLHYQGDERALVTAYLDHLSKKEDSR